MTKKTDSINAIKYDQIGSTDSGLTKQEYFAAMAMQGLLSAPGIEEDLDIVSTQRSKDLARISVVMANNLISELNAIC